MVSTAETHRFRLLFQLCYPSVYGKYRKRSNKSTIEKTITWNGTQETFKNYYDLFLANIGQQGMAYVGDQGFKKEYMDHPNQTAYAIATDAGFQANLTKEALVEDNSYVLSALLQSVRSEIPKILIDKFRTNGRMDGIGALYALEDKYRFGANATYIASEYEATIEERWNPKIPLRKWVDRKLKAFNELDQLKPKRFPDDASKIEKLGDSLSHSSNTFLVSKVKDQTTFVDCIGVIDEQIALEDSTKARSHIRSHVRNVGSEETVEDNEGSLETSCSDADFLIQMIKHTDDPEHCRRLVMMAQGAQHDGESIPLKKIPAEYRLLPQCVKILGKEKTFDFMRNRIKYLKERNILPSNDKANTLNTSSTSSTTPSSNLGKQYPARYAHLIQSCDDSELEALEEIGAFAGRTECLTSDDETSETSADDSKKILATIVESIQDIQEKMHTGHARATLTHYNIRNLLAVDDTWYFAAIDNGADSSVIGKGWSIHSYVMGQNGREKRANLIGFDKNLSKRGLPVVCALAVVEVGDVKHLLRINQAVYNEKADLTLLSDFQMKEHGWLIDSTSRRHRSYNPDGTGSQQMQNDDGVIIPFSVRSCLMTFKIRKPTTDEMETMTPIDLTSDAPWDPQAHVELDDDVILLTQTSQPESSALIANAVTDSVTDPQDTSESLN